MTAFGTAERPPVPLRPAISFLVGIAGLAFSLTILWLSMRVVMGIGGACASGGPYVPAVECPDSVVALTPVSIFGLFLFGGLALWGGASLGGAWVALIALAWPVLFLSLGWNFLEFGLRPPGAEPGEVEWGWLFCAVIFGLMGGVPLALGIWGAAQARHGAAGLVGRALPVPSRGRYEVHVVDRGQRGDRGASATGDVATRLERLARLHDAGDLTAAEFEAAKRATIDEAGR